MSWTHAALTSLLFAGTALADPQPWERESPWERALPHLGVPGRVLGGGVSRGPFVSVDAGLALAPGATEGRGVAPAASLRLGWQFPVGLAVSLNLAALDASAARLGDGSLRVVTFGGRYTVPFLLPQPFVEAAVGGAWTILALPPAPGPTVLATTLGAGVSAPFTRFFAVELAVRDHIAFYEPFLAQVIALELGVTLFFPGG